MKIYNNETGELGDYDEYRKHEVKFTQDFNNKKAVTEKEMPEVVSKYQKKTIQKTFVKITMKGEKRAKSKSKKKD